MLYTKYFQTETANFLTGLFIVLAVFSANADELSSKISGVVKNSDSSPVVAATVTLIELNKSTATDADGRFEFLSVNPGQYTIRVEHLAFATIEKEVEITTKPSSDLQLTLTEKPVEMPGITVIGSTGDYLKVKQQMSQIPGSVALVNSQDIQKTRQANLRDVLRFVPGVWTQSRFGAADESQLSVRGSGLRNNFHLRGINLLVNGMPYRNADGFTDFESLELLTTSNIQVYKGGNSLRYGGATLGGAVNLETKTGYSSNPIQAYGSGGSFNYYKYQLSTGQVLGDNNYYASYAKTNLGGFREYSSQWRDRVNFNLGKVFSENFNARMFYFFADVQEDLPGQLTKAQFDADPRQANSNNVANRWGRDYTLHHVGVQLRSQLSENMRLEVAPYMQYRDIVHPIFRVIDQISRDYGVEARLESDITTGQRTHRTYLGVQLASGNTDNRHFDNVGGNSTTLRKDQKEKAGVAGIYAEGIWAVSDDFSAVTGFRFDRSRRQLDDRFLSDGDQTDERNYNAFLPKIGAVYGWQKVNGQVYANVSRSYEPPLLLELNSFTRPGFVDLSAQDAWQFEIGTRGIKSTLSWDFSLFMLDIENEIININVQPFPGAPFTVPSYRNAASTRHYGVELGLTTESRALKQKSREEIGTGARVAYTFARCKYHNDPVYGNNHLPGLPDHTIQGEVSLWHPIGLTLSPNIELVPKDYAITSDHAVHNDGWTVLGIRADYNVSRIGANFAIELRNLTDGKYSPTVSVDNAAGMFYEPADGRSIYASFTWFR